MLRAEKAAASSAPKNRSLTARISALTRSSSRRPAGAKLMSTPRRSSGFERLSSNPSFAILPVSAAMKALDTCMAWATAPTLTPRAPCRCATATRRLYCGPVMPMRRPRCARTSSMRLAMVKRSLTRVRNRRSDPLSRRAGRVAVGGKTWAAVAPSGLGFAAAFARGRPSLEIDIAGIAEQRGFHRDVQAVVHGVVEFPESDHAGELDDLRRRQVLLQPLENFFRHRGRVLGGRADIIKARALHLVLRLVGAGDDLLQLFLAQAPALGPDAARLLQHRAAVRGAIGAAVGGAGDRGELALEQLVERRSGIAHHVAVELPQRLGDLRPVRVELERVRQETHALLVGLEHRLEPGVEVLLAHVGNERLGLEQNLRLGRGDGIHGGAPSEIIGQLHLAPVAGPGTFEIRGIVARLDRGIDSHL